jgi:hypothetical protein
LEPRWRGRALERVSKAKSGVEVGDVSRLSRADRVTSQSLRSEVGLWKYVIEREIPTPEPKGVHVSLNRIEATRP